MGCHVVFHALIGAQVVLVAVLENDNLFVLLLLHVRAVYFLMPCFGSVTLSLLYSGRLC